MKNLQKRTQGASSGDDCDCSPQRRPDDVTSRDVSSSAVVSPSHVPIAEDVWRRLLASRQNHDLWPLHNLRPDSRAWRPPLFCISIYTRPYRFAVFFGICPSSVVVPKRCVWIFSVLSSQYLVIEVGSLITLLYLKLRSFPIFTCVSPLAVFKNVLSIITGEHSDTNFIFNGKELFTINTRCVLECIRTTKLGFHRFSKIYTSK